MHAVKILRRGIKNMESFGCAFYGLILNLKSPAKMHLEMSSAAYILVTLTYDSKEANSVVSNLISADTVCERGFQTFQQTPIADP